MKQLVLAGRLIFGAWMLANGASHFLVPLWPTPTGAEPLAAQLMSALVHSGLFDIAMAIQLVTGVLILAGLLVPVALCIAMPVSTCAVYWSVVLEHQPLGAVLALAAFFLNGLLMLAYLDYYRAALQRHAVTLGEASAAPFEALFVRPGGRTSRRPYVAALITLLAVVAFYLFLVKGRTALWSLAVVLLPAVILHARRLHDMGRTAWLLLAPGLLMVAAFGIWLRIISLGGQLDAALPPTALVVSVGFALWGCVARGQAEANRYGAPAAARES